MLFELRERLTRPRPGGQARARAPTRPIATALEYAGVQRTLGASATVPDAITDLEGERRISRPIGTLFRDIRAAPAAARALIAVALLRTRSQAVWAMSGDARDLGSVFVDFIPPDAIKRLHDNKDIGSYDAAVLTKAMDGTISVNKDEKPVKHGAYAGLAAGAGAAILFPPLLLVTAPAAIGAGVGAWMGHLAHGMSRKDAKAMAAQLQPGQAAPHRGGDRRGLGSSRAGHGRFAEPYDQASRGLGLRRR